MVTLLWNGWSTLVTTFFKPLSSNREAKVTNADTTTNCSETACSDSTCSEDSVSESEPEASQMSLSESIETQRNCSDSDPQSVRVQTRHNYPRKIVFTPEPEVQL